MYVFFFLELYHHETNGYGHMKMKLTVLHLKKILVYPNEDYYDYYWVTSS